MALSPQRVANWWSLFSPAELKWWNVVIQDLVPSPHWLIRATNTLLLPHVTEATELLITAACSSCSSCCTSCCSSCCSTWHEPFCKYSLYLGSKVHQQEGNTLHHYPPEQQQHRLPVHLTKLKLRLTKWSWIQIISDDIRISSLFCCSYLCGYL